MNKRQVGTVYESRAAEYLRGLGYQLMERNFRCRMGEIDIIAREGEVLCFIEVKYRAGAGRGTPLEAVNRRKQQKIISVARYYLMSHNMAMDTECRFDVVAVEGEHMTLLQNAFGE